VSDTRRAYSWRFLMPLFMGSSLNAINSTMLATALVPIAANLHVAVGSTAILITALYLASAVAQPTAGKLAEEFGPRRVFLAGIIVVAAGGLLGGLVTLIIARILIGVGTSAGYPSAMLLVRRRAEAVGLTAAPGSVLGGLQITGTVMGAVGLPIGGFLVDAFGWRTTFFVNVPFALAALGMALLWIPPDTPLKAAQGLRGLAERVDFVGIAGFAAAMSAFLAFLFSLPSPNWLMLAVGLVLGGLLLAWELRVSRPFLDLRLLARNGALSRTYLRFGLTMFCA
jgi:MFS family permease